MRQLLVTATMQLCNHKLISAVNVLSVLIKMIHLHKNLRTVFYCILFRYYKHLKFNIPGSIKTKLFENWDKTECKHKDLI